MTARRAFAGQQARNDNRKRAAPTPYGMARLVDAPPPRTCQWLDGEPRERNFCGRDVRPGSSYCPEHHARCHLPKDAVAGVFYGFPRWVE